MHIINQKLNNKNVQYHVITIHLLAFLYCYAGALTALARLISLVQSPQQFLCRLVHTATEHLFSRNLAANTSSQ